MTTQTLELNNIERKIFWVLASFVGLAVGFYFYSVTSLTVAVVDRDHMNATAHELAAKSADIEQEYLTQANSITLAYAQGLGFHEVSAKFAGTNASPITLDTGSKLSMAR